MSKTGHANQSGIQEEIDRLKNLLIEEKKKRKQIEKQLASTREHSKSVVDAEKQFLANMSHEIRNPINAIVGLINLLYDTKLTAEQFEYVNNIKYSADILTSLIADILDLSKIEAGKVDLSEKVIDIGEVIRAIVQTYSFKTHDQDIRFKIDLDDQLRGYYKVDPTVINQIFLNLIGNAVKFTEKGTIRIEGRMINRMEDLVTAEFNIKDTGIGIPESQLSEIFEVFRQGTLENKLKYGGTGLGLSIVKKLISLYNGHITVKSVEGKGSTFSFTLNILRVDQQRSIETGKDQVSGTTINLQRVLIVEDNKINQQYLTWLLEKWEIAYDVASNGEEALDLTERNKYDLILMDIRMPVMDGYETTIRLRNRSLNPNYQVPIIALTASALVDEKEKALKVGMNSHLSKPFSPDQLRTMLNMLEPAGTEDPQAGEFQFSGDLNTEYLNRFYGDDIERARLMFDIFLKNIDHQLHQLQQDLTDKDHKAFAALAHKIKPNFAMVGLPELGERMKEMESAANTEDFSKLDENLPDFHRIFTQKKLFVIRELDNISRFLGR